MGERCDGAECAAARGGALRGGGSLSAVPWNEFQSTANVAQLLTHINNLISCPVSPTHMAGKFMASEIQARSVVGSATGAFASPVVTVVVTSPPKFVSDAEVCKAHSPKGLFAGRRSSRRLRLMTAHELASAIASASVWNGPTASPSGRQPGKHAHQ